MVNTFETFYNHFDFPKVTFEEFSDKLSILDISNKTSEYAIKNTVSGFIKEATLGQIASFNKIVVTDNSYLVLDAASFKLLDTASQSQSIFKTGGIESVRGSNNNATDIYGYVVAGAANSTVDDVDGL